MHEVSKAINVLDPTEGIDKKICGTNDWNSGAAEADGKCNSGKGTPSSITTKAFSGMFKADSSNNLYPEDKEKQMSEYPKTSAKIATDITALNRNQHGVVSSAFAKADASGNNVGRTRYTSMMYII
ncbi:hypothetical protein [Anaplasma bovis]|uniref:hypothetical protein n=1 Tax=Anaplasma bovis TaxID=186733 RepID=UPI002FEFC35C